MKIYNIYTFTTNALRFFLEIFSRMPNLRQLLRRRRCYSVFSCVNEFQHAKPYSEIPGPKPIPIIGNTWRLMPIIGQYDISDVAKVNWKIITFCNFCDASYKFWRVLKWWLLRLFISLQLFYKFKSVEYKNNKNIQIVIICIFIFAKEVSRPRRYDSAILRCIKFKILERILKIMLVLSIDNCFRYLLSCIKIMVKL